MQWETPDKDWKWRFAIFPFHISTGPTRRWVWLEWYQARNGGYFTEVKFLPREAKGDSCVAAREPSHVVPDGGNDRDIQLRRDARALATGVLDLGVGCLDPEEARTIAARIIAATPL